MLIWWLLAKPIANIIGGLVKPIIAIAVIVFVDLYFQIGIIDMVLYYVMNWIEQLVINTVKDSVGLQF